jgi:hypothetical protein
MPSNQDTRTMDSARPTVGAGEGVTPFNTRQVHPYEPTADSATIDVYTGISDLGKLTKLRERAVYDLNSLSYAPIASSGTGVLFPDAVRAKTEVETALRIRPTTFKGPQQLDVAGEKGEVHLNRQMHPNASNVSDQTWFKQKGDVPFVGFPNPDLFYTHTDPILSHNVQNLSHAQLTEALRTSNTGFDHNEYIGRVGALMKSDALAGPAHASIDHVVQSDGGGVNGDPRLLERIAEEYERDFQKARRLRVASATNDPRYGESAPGLVYTKEQQEEQLAKETQYSKVAKFWGIGSGFAEPEKFHVG